MPRFGDEASAMRMALVAKDRTLCLIIVAGVVSGGTALPGFNCLLSARKQQSS